MAQTASQVAIANRALTLLAQPVIASFTDTSQSASVMNVLWDQVRQSLLRLHPWTFALKVQVELAQVEGASTPDYQYVYQIPVDCLKVWDVKCDHSYLIAQNQIYSNQSTCYLTYVFDSVEPSSWSPDFCEVMAYKLAVDGMYAILHSDADVELRQSQFEKILQKAKTMNGMEYPSKEFARAPQDSSLVNVRY